MSYDYKATWSVNVFDAEPIKELTDIIEKQTNGKRVLYLGCGAGRNIPALWQSRYSLSVDISKSAIDRAYERAKKIDREDCWPEVLCADVNEIDFPDNYFDVILTNVVLQHIIPEKIEFLALKMRKWAPHIIMMESRADKNIPLTEPCFDHDYEKLFNIVEKIHYKDNTYIYVHTKQLKTCSNEL